MTMKHNTDRISIQVGLSGYSFKIEADGQERSSGWMSADKIFTTSEFQKKYSEVEISVFTPKCTLVPAQFHSPEVSAGLLADVVRLDEGDTVSYVELPDLGSVLVYSNIIGETLSKVISETVMTVDGMKTPPLPEIYYMLKSLSDLEEYNKIVASYVDGVLYLVIAQGRTLLLCNTYKAPDFTTAEYFIFLAMKKLQLNPEMSTITFRTPLDEEEEMSLYRYFKNVDII